MLFFFFIYIIYKKQKIKMGCIKVKSSSNPFIIKSKQNISKNNYEKEKNNLNEDSLFPDIHSSQNDEIMTLNNNNFNLLEIEKENNNDVENITINKQNKSGNISETITLISINNSFYSNEMNNKICINESVNIKNNNSNQNKSILNVMVNANRYEAMYPIWIEKDSEIIFKVNGKWKINNLKECTSIGIENEKENKNEKIDKTKIVNNNVNDNNIINNENNFNNGALIGRILNDIPFVIYDNLSFVSKKSGPLFLKMNIKKCFCKFSPSGKLFLKIIGAKNIESFDKIDELIGWDKDIKKLEYCNNNNNICSLSFLDKETIIFFNKMRFNSNLFATLYLNNIKDLNKYTNDLYEFMIKQEKKIEKFKVNFIFIKLIENFYKPFLGRKNKMKNKKKLILYSQKDLEEYLKENFEYKKKFKIFFKIHEYNKPMSLSIKFILDENIRREIFNEENKEIALLTLRTRRGQKINHFSILIFSDKVENLEIDFSKKISLFNLIQDINKPNIHKSNLEIIYEEQIKKKKSKMSFENKIILLNELYNYKNKDDNSIHNLQKSKSNLEENNIEEYKKISYKSDDEKYIHKKKSLIDDKEDDE